LSQQTVVGEIYCHVEVCIIDNRLIMLKGIKVVGNNLNVRWSNASHIDVGQGVKSKIKGRKRSEFREESLLDDREMVVSEVKGCQFAEGVENACRKRREAIRTKMKIVERLETRKRNTGKRGEAVFTEVKCL